MAKDQTSLPDYWDQLKRADWFYDYSDDASVWRRGAEEFGRLQRIAKESEAHQALYDGWKAHMNSPPLDGRVGRQVDPPERPEK